MKPFVAIGGVLDYLKFFIDLLRIADQRHNPNPNPNPKLMDCRAHTAACWWVLRLSS